MAIPGMISLGGGLPNPSTFPFQSLSITLSDGSTLPLDGAALKEALQYRYHLMLPASAVSGVMHFISLIFCTILT
jgi:kynurenine/2-aminoadipate aminotransferase